MTDPGTRRTRLRRPLVLAAALALVGLSTPAAVGGATTAPVSRVGASAVDGRIVYVNGDTLQLETSNPDGTAVEQVTDVDGAAQQPVWLPDASRIVFASDMLGSFGIFSIKPDGTGLRTVLHEDGFDDFTPAVTPDGSRALFGRCRPDPPGGCALFSVGLDGTGLTALTSYDPSSLDFWPDVSPDGRQVAFTRFGGGGIAVQTWVMHSDGSHARPLTAPRLEASRPRWFPDSTTLALTVNWAHLQENIITVRANGSHLHRLTKTAWPHNSGFATPSPSGTRILFSNDDAYTDLIGFDQFLMRSDGSGRHRVRSGRFFDNDWGTAPLQSRTAAPAPSTRTSQRAAPPSLGPWARALIPRGAATSRR